SIRKAQLFGEIGQRYGLTADASVSLDDFTTLRHLLDYMLPRVGGGAASVAAASQPPVGGALSAALSTALSAAAERGRRLGRDHAEAIRTWARQLAAAPPRTVPAITDPAITAELAGIAEAAGVDESIVRAAFTEPARALGGCAAIVVAPRDAAAARGVLACFGRGADPDVRPFDVAGIRGTLVGAKGLPGGILGWNDAGLVVLAEGGAAAAAVEAVVTTCRSAAEAESTIAGCAPIPTGLVLADLVSGVHAVSASGTLVAEQPFVTRIEPGSALARIALADGAVAPADAIARFVGAADGAARAALSAAAPWLVVGVAAGAAAQRSGGPLGHDWLGGGSPGGAWTATARNQEQLQSAERSADVTRRYIVTTNDLPPAQPVRSLRGERVLVLGGGPTAEAVRAAVVAEGAIAVSEAPRTSDEAVAAVDRAEAHGPVRHLVLTSARPGRPGRWLDRGDEAVAAPFFACQRWIGLRSTSGDLDRATLTAVSDLGGDFGLSGSIGAAEGGAVAGLFKNLIHEFPSLHVRVVDAATATPPAAVAAGVVAEMRGAAGPVEIGLAAGRRLGVVPREAAAVPAGRLAALDAGSVWIATGGARGVTAACCRELGRRYPVRLVLLGSTQPVDIEPAWLALDDAGLRDVRGRIMLEAKQRGADPRAAWRAVEKSREIQASLAAFRAAGVDARYEACDLADAAAVRALVQRVERQLGPVRGIVHGAGFEAACRFEKKTREGFLATLTPKCVGIEHLLAAVDPAALEAVIGFGSTSGRLGGHGQADYSLANDLLAKIVGSLRRSRPGLRATVFHWHAWDEVGMASRPESRFVLEQFGLRFMPLAEGVRRFMDEIEAGLPDTEVLVTEPAMCPDAIAAAQPRAAAAAAVAAPAEFGSLVERVESRPDATWVSFRLDPTSDRFLIDHLQYGRPLLPAVMGAELLAQAVRAAHGGAEVREIRDFVVERPIAFPLDAVRDVRVEVGPVGPAGVEARGWTAVVTADGRTAGEDRVHVHGRIVPGKPEPVDAVLEQPPFPFNPMYYQEDAPLRHGPSFRTLDGLFLDRSGGWGRLVSQHGDGVALPRGSKGWTVPVGLLDGCIVACAVYSYILCGRRVEIPVQFERLRVCSQARGGEKCTSRLFFRSQDSRETVYDVVLFGDDGRVILAVDGLHLAVIGGERGRSA
ncbi:MAG: Phthiocerol/phenolphthiocerol synthesis polyketide synthase type PpsA, partial [Planctomycetota bacterium]